MVSKGGITIQEEQYSRKTILGQPFPEITSKSLAGDVVSLPKAAEGKVTFLCIAFVRSAQSMLESWVQPFDMEFGKDSRFAFYEVPMINAAWKVLSWMVDSGMRSGIPVEKHGSVVTFYGDYTGYQEALGIVDTSLAYIFVLDKKGIVRWRGQGYANPESKKEFIEALKALV